MYMYKIKYMRGGKPNNLATTMSNIRFKFTIILVIMTILMIIPISTHAKDEDKTNQNIKLGDINMDSKIDSSDLLLLLRHVYASENGKKQEWILTGNKFLAGDITRNKKIDSSDTIAILRHIAAIGNKEIGNKHKDWIIKEEENITLNKTSIELKIGESEKLEVTSSENEKITWSSSNEKVAIVDSEGKVTAKGEGEATITAKTSNGKEAKCTIKVTNGLNVIIKEESGDGYIKTVTVGQKKYKVYSQHLFGSNSISSSGCSISSEAIVLSGYGKNNTPYTIAQDVGWEFPRSISQIAEDLTGYGVKSTARVDYSAGSDVKNKAIQEIDNNLKQGKPVLILVRGRPYTGVAHYMVLVGYMNGKPVIADPNGGDTWNDDSLEDLVNNHIYRESDYEQGYVLVD